MDEPEARLILQAYRPGLEENDPEAAEALQMAERDPALGRWLAEEQEFDRAMAAHLEAIPASLYREFLGGKRQQDRFVESEASAEAIAAQSVPASVVDQLGVLFTSPTLCDLA